VSTKTTAPSVARSLNAPTKTVATAPMPAESKMVVA